MILARYSFAAVLSLGLALPAAGLAQNAADLLDGSDPAAILRIAEGYGSAMLDKDSVGDPMIEGRIDGQSYTVFFYGCEGGAGCSSIQFTTYFAGVRPDAAVVSDWNDENRFGTLYLDGDGDLAIDLDVNLFGGVTRKNLDDTFDWWRVVLEEVRADLVP
ncbi:MAG: YbjN domain-containing protein [Alphaproteobacteria bacterium]|nr:YbjN domain-containing protein [Paracoccaceae bacterium]